MLYACRLERRDLELGSSSEWDHREPLSRRSALGSVEGLNETGWHMRGPFSLRVKRKLSSDVAPMRVHSTLSARQPVAA